MKTILSSKGQIVLPAELRKRDRIATGDRFTIERLEAGRYVLTREKTSSGILEWLLACPHKVDLEPMDRSETTDDAMRRIEREVFGRHERAERGHSTRAGSTRRRVARRSRG